MEIYQPCVFLQYHKKYINSFCCKHFCCNTFKVFSVVCRNNLFNNIATLIGARKSHFCLSWKLRNQYYNRFMSSFAYLFSKRFKFAANPKFILSNFNLFRTTFRKEGIKSSFSPLLQAFIYHLPNSIRKFRV